MLREFVALVNEAVDDGFNRGLNLFMENLDRIFAVLRALGYEISLEEKLKDYLDSLDLVELVMMIEQEFKILITNEEIAEIVTVEDVLRLVNSKLDAK